MWTWLCFASLALASGGLGPGMLPALPSALWARATFTLGEIDARHLGLPGQEAEIRRALIARLRHRGLPVRGAEPKGPDRTSEARFVLLGELRPTGSPRAATVRWQLVDRRDDYATFEALTEVALGPPSPRPLQDALDRLVNSDAFFRALTRAAQRAGQTRGAIQLRRCLTPGTHGRGRIGRGSEAGAAVVVSPDGYAWASAQALPIPPAPIEIRTATGTWEARWLRASADLDVALLALPTGTATPCVAMADHLPRAREKATVWHPRQGRQRTRILGFRLHERPGTLVVEAPLAPGAFLLDATGALLGLRAPGTDEPRVRPHHALAGALDVRWGPTSVVPGSPDRGLETPDPIFLPPVDRARLGEGLQ